MNLEQALNELLRRPQSMVAGDGHGYPALKYTKNLNDAITWLVERYNDGTLKVEGYDFEQNVRQKKLTTHAQRRGARAVPQYEVGSYMSVTEFVKKSGMGMKAVKRIAKEAKAYYYGGSGCKAYVNIPKFYDFLDNKCSIYKDKNYMNLTEAAEALGASKKEVKQLIAKGILKVHEDLLKKHRVYLINGVSVIEYRDSMKGGKDGQIDSNDGEVLGD